jgi:hypothetical protein
MLGEILSSSSKNYIEQIHERYVLLAHDDNEFHHDCPIIELLKSDIDSSKRPLIYEYYQSLIDKYGKESVDLLIVEDEKFIQSKILNILNLAMDQIYKSDTIRVEFLRYTKSPSKVSSIPSLIYLTIGENFDIIDQQLLKQQNYIVIKKRGKLL